MVKQKLKSELIQENDILYNKIRSLENSSNSKDREINALCDKMEEIRERERTLLLNLASMNFQQKVIGENHEGKDCEFIWTPDLQSKHHVGAYNDPRRF